MGVVSLSCALVLPLLLVSDRRKNHGASCPASIYDNVHNVDIRQCFVSRGKLITVNEGSGI